jgi:hypothetical protein
LSLNRLYFWLCKRLKVGSKSLKKNKTAVLTVL